MANSTLEKNKEEGGDVPRRQPQDAKANVWLLLPNFRCRRSRRSRAVQPIGGKANAHNRPPPPPPWIEAGEGGRYRSRVLLLPFGYGEFGGWVCFFLFKMGPGMEVG